MPVTEWALAVLSLPGSASCESGLLAAAQVWDMRSKNQIHVLGGHTNTVGALLTQAVDPQVITGGMDSQVKVCLAFMRGLCPSLC